LKMELILALLMLVPIGMASLESITPI